MGSELKLAETPYFGVQGEGKHVGQRMLFVRTQGCDVGCNYCDSMYTWPNTAPYTCSIESLADNIAFPHEDKAEKFTRVWLTGGEPSIYSVELEKLCMLTYEKVEDTGRFVMFYMCTAGTVFVPSFVELLYGVTLDIKPPSAEAKQLSVEQIREWIDYCHGTLELKATISPNISDIEYIRNLLENLNEPNLQFTIQPQLPNEREVRSGLAQNNTKWDLGKFVEAVSDLQKDYHEVRVGYQMHKIFYPNKTRGI